MKIDVIIEEVISQRFEKVEVSSIENAYKEIREMYRSGKLVVENPELTEANIMIIDDESGEESDWNNLHV